jgi:hypothetical protein
MQITTDQKVAATLTVMAGSARSAARRVAALPYRSWLHLSPFTSCPLPFPQTRPTEPGKGVLVQVSVVPGVGRRSRVRRFESCPRLAPAPARILDPISSHALVHVSGLLRRRLPGSNPRRLVPYLTGRRKACSPTCCPGLRRRRGRGRARPGHLRRYGLWPGRAHRLLDAARSATPLSAGPRPRCRAAPAGTASPSTWTPGP